MKNNQQERNKVIKKKKYRRKKNPGENYSFHFHKNKSCLFSVTSQKVEYPTNE